MFFLYVAETFHSPENNEAIVRMLQGLAAMPMVLELLQKQGEEISSMREELRALRTNQYPPSEQPEGYIDPKTLAALKFLTVKQAAFLLNTSVKSVRRLIERGLLKTSKGLRVMRIPKEEIEAYKNLTL